MNIIGLSTRLIFIFIPLKVFVLIFSAFVLFIWSYFFNVFPDQTYKAFLPAMIANNHGHLVSIASSAGLIGINGLAGMDFVTISNVFSYDHVKKHQLIKTSKTAA